MTFNRRSPRRSGVQPEAQNKETSCFKDITTASETQGLRFAIHRLDKSRNYLRYSLLKGQETLALLKSHPDPEAAPHVARQELRAQRTKARLEDVQGALGALYAALLRLEEVHYAKH